MNGRTSGDAAAASRPEEVGPIAVRRQLDVTTVPTPSLERLADALARAPGSRPSGALLARLALEPHATSLDALGALPAEAARAVLEAVLAERRGRRPADVELVWTGPEAAASASRASAAVLRQLFEGAREHVLVGGYAFDHGRDLFAPLHRAMAERGVAAQLFLDLAGDCDESADVAAFAADRVGRFLRDNWPFGEPHPELWYDPRTAHRGASLHAKCVVVDFARALVTSANFTDRGQTRNLEVGELVHDPAFARRLAEQWRGLIGAGLVRRYRG